jgi:hypothetical protein
MKKGRVAAGIALVCLLVSVFTLGPSGLRQLGILNPGFEGAKCTFYGADFQWKDWSGSYQIHPYGLHEETLVSHAAFAASDRVYWVGAATPNDVGIGWNRQTGMNVEEEPVLGIHVESNIQLEDIDRQGDPIGWNTSDPQTGRRIEYWSRTAEKEETADKILYHYTLTKESFLIVPAEFWVGFYLTPSDKDVGQAWSGWREGTWNNIVVWFRLDFVTWDNAYYDPWLDDPKSNVFTTMYDGYVLNQERTYEYRGGFPIAGWIQGWEKAGYQRMAWESGDIGDYSRQATDFLWYQTRGDEQKIYADSSLADNSELQSKLKAKCSVSPGLIGQFLSLYDAPGSSFTYELQAPNFADNQSQTNLVKAPDTRMKKTMYFPINLIEYGTYAEQVNVWTNAWKVYYPSVYLRVRMIFGVYGQFTYLWTEELAKDPVIKYPDVVELHETSVIYVENPILGGIGDWFNNPWNLLLLFIFGALIVIALIAVVSPASLGLAVAAMSRKKR